MYDLNNIKLEKVVDLGGQIFCFAILLVLSVITMNAEYMFLAYFTVGGWQVLSCLFNLSRMKSSYIDSSRKMYNNLLLIVVVALVAAGFLLLFVCEEVLLFLLLALLFLSPLMAIQYAIITYNEYHNVSKQLNAQCHE